VTQMVHVNIGARRSPACGFTRNNGITEGFHTKMEVLQRKSMGFATSTTTASGLRYLCSRGQSEAGLPH
jgi:hypothetical protein